MMGFAPLNPSYIDSTGVERFSWKLQSDLFPDPYIPPIPTS